jgi:hypothetical protein
MTDKPDGKPKPERVLAATAIFTVIVLVINLLMGLVQCADHLRWGAMHIVLVENPVANLILFAIGVALAPVIRRQAQGASVRFYAVVAIVLPLFMIPCQAIVPHIVYDFLK